MVKENVTFLPEKGKANIGINQFASAWKILLIFKETLIIHTDIFLKRISFHLIRHHTALLE